MTVVLPRRKLENESRAVVRDKIHIAIPEIEGAELIARIPQQEIIETPYMIDVYYWQDCFWTPCVQTKGPEAGTILPADVYLADLKSGGYISSGPQLFYKSEPYRTTLFEKPEDVVVRAIVSSDRDEVVAEIESRAASMVFMNGAILRKVGEPVIFAQPSDQGFLSFTRKKYVFPKYGFLNRNSVSAQGTWRLDRGDRMLEILGAIPEMEPIDLLPAEVYRTDMLEWDREREQMISAVQSNMERLRGDKATMFADASLEAFTVFDQIRRLHSDIEHADEAALVALGEAAVLFNEMGPSEHMKYSKPFDATVEAFESLLEDRRLSSQEELSLESYRI